MGRQPSVKPEVIRVLLIGRALSSHSGEISKEDSSKGIRRPLRAPPDNVELLRRAEA